MTDNTKLIAQLRKIASKGVSVWGDLQMQAADALEAAQAQIAGANQLAQLNGEIAAGLKTELLDLRAQEPLTPPPGYKFVVVPEVDESEPDWGEVRRQAELVTGLKVEQNTYSIIIREVRRWIASIYAAAGTSPVQPSHPDEFSCPLCFDGKQPDTDHNAPWLSDAHMLCADQGIPPGHITDRIRALRDKLVQPAQQFTWADVGKLIGATDQARAAGLTVGTSNWGAFVCKAMGVQPAKIPAAQQPFGWYDPSSDKFSRDRDAHKRGATLWAVYRDAGVKNDG